MQPWTLHLLHRREREWMVMHRLGGETLSHSEAWGLLRTESLGNVALSIGALPAILPVQYYVDEDRIVFCLGHHDVPWEAITNTVAAFSVTSTVAPFLEGWSVHVLGTLRESLGDRVDCGQQPAGRLVYMNPAAVTGERLQLCSAAG